jgi:hypothetical protein
MDSTQAILWFAGLFEGEGFFTFNKNRPRGMGINMTDEDVIRQVQTLFGGSVYELRQAQSHHKKQWRWTLLGEDSVALATSIEPFLFSRRKARCREFIDKYITRDQYNAARQEQRDLLRSQVKELRREGLTHQAIADKLSISKWYVGDILRGRYEN